MSAADWDSEVAGVARKAAPDTIAIKRTAAWWNEFWNRSWIFVDSGRDAPLPENSETKKEAGDGSCSRTFLKPTSSSAI